MKSNERHELQRNDLADGLAQAGRKIRPVLGYLLVAVIIALAAVLIINRRSEGDTKAEAEAVSDLAAARQVAQDWRPGQDMSKILDARIEALRKHLEKYPDSSVVHLARKRLADRLYDRAMVNWARGLPEQRVEQDLAEAEKLYGPLAERGGRIGLHAVHGLACIAAERGNVEEARRQLTGLVEEHGDQLIARMARERLDVLAADHTLRFSTPEPPARPEPPEADDGAADEPAAAQPTGDDAGAPAEQE